MCNVLCKACNTGATGACWRQRASPSTVHAMLATPAAAPQALRYSTAGRPQELAAAAASLVISTMSSLIDLRSVAGLPGGAHVRGIGWRDAQGVGWRACMCVVMHVGGECG